MSTLPNTPKQVPCPSCGTLQVWSESNPWRPFCSERCKTMDLGAWATGEYRIPGQENLLDEETLLN